MSISRYMSIYIEMDRDRKKERKERDLFYGIGSCDYRG